MRASEAVLVDQDLLWSVSPDHDDPESGYFVFRRLVLHLALRIAANGHMVVVEGSTHPPQYERHDELQLFAFHSYLSLTCDEGELVRRLRSRPGWRGWTDERIEGMTAYNRFFREEGPSLEPPIPTIDTSGRTVGDVATEVHEWIRGQRARWAAMIDP